MAYFDEIGGLGIAARALRLALIILPVAAVFLSVIRIVQSAELLQTHWGHSLAFLIAHDALYPLLYLAFGLWAAHVIKPFNFLNLSVLKWALIGLAVALLAGNLYFDHKGTIALLSHFTKGGYRYFSLFAVGMANALGFAVICIFAATTLPRFKIEPPETVSGAAAVLRRALIIVPIVGLSLAVISMLLFRIDAVGNGFTVGVFVNIVTFITPLAYLAIGLWAANLIKPIKGVDVQPLKWGLILIGIVLPVLSAYNDLELFFEFKREGPDGGLWLLQQFTEDPEFFVLFIDYWIRDIIFALICFFVAYKIEAPESEKTGDNDANKDIDIVAIAEDVAKQSRAQSIIWGLGFAIVVFAAVLLFESIDTDYELGGLVSETYSDGGRYEGDFVEGIRNGKGSYAFPGGNRYEGDFVNGNFNGKGTYYYSNGDRYEGDFLNGERTGSGAFFRTDGTQYEGKFINGDYIER